MISSNRRILLQAAVAIAAAKMFSAFAAAPLRLAYLDTYKPISFRQDDGAMHGILIDLLDEVLVQRMKIPLEHKGYPWARAQFMVESGLSDALCATPTPARLKYAIASQEAVLKLPWRIFANIKSPLLPKLEKVRNLDELRSLNPKVISYIGNSWARGALAGFNVYWSPDFESSLRMVNGARGDLAVESSIAAQHWLNSHPEMQDIRMLPHAMDEVVFHLLIGKQSPHLAVLPSFDREVQKFKNEAAYAKILQRYGVRS